MAQPRHLNKFIVAGISVMALAISCSHRPVVDPKPEPAEPFSSSACRRQVLEGDYAAAVTACRERHDRLGDADSGYALAIVASKKNDHDRLVYWADSLSGTTREADTRYLLGRSFGRQGSAEPAELQLRQAAELFIARDLHGKAANAYSELFRLFRAADQRQLLEVAGMGLESARRSQQAGKIRGALFQLFEVSLDTGDLKTAGSVLTELDTLIPASDVNRRAALALNSAAFRVETGQLHKARSELRNILALGDGLTRREIVRAALVQLIDLDLDAGDLESARNFLRQANLENGDSEPSLGLRFAGIRVALAAGEIDSARERLESAPAESSIPDDWRWRYAMVDGRIAIAERDPDSARKALERSVNIVMGLRNRLGFPELKESLLREKREPFEALFALHAHRGDARAALEVAEQAKARAFLDSLVNDSFAADFDQAEENEPGEDRLHAISLAAPLVAETPLARLRPLDQILSKLGGSRIVMFFVADGQAWMIDVTSEPEAYLLGNAAELADLIARFASRPEDASDAEQLGARLFPGDWIPPKHGRLSIVTDRELGRIPFAALRREERYFAEQFVISMLPSLNAHAAIAERTRPAVGTPAVFGDPSGDLPSAGLEAAQVAERLSVKPVLGNDATRQNLAAASGTPLLHLGTHGGIDAGGAWLELADGRVHFGDLLREPVRSRVVVLAGCRSAARDGYGMWGAMASAFLITGADNVIATLSSVEDEPTREMILSFYAEGGIDDPPTALAAAQRTAISRGRAVESWAPFVAFGINDSSE